jgi:transformation/transcription domain-associated protein
VPNDWDPLHEWDDLLYWRLQVFQKIQERRIAAAGGDVLAAAAAAGQPVQAGGAPPDPSRVAPEYQDTAWSMIRLARAARKQGLNDVALNILCRIPLASMAVPDCFGKLREQITVCHQALRMNSNTVGQLQGVLPGSAGQSATLAQAGLSIINHTNLEYFTPEQTAELFRLKALFLAAQDQRGEANQAFSHAMQIAGAYGKGWLTWGRYADELYEKEPINRIVGLNAMACYLEAVNHSAAEGAGARLLLSRVLQMLLIDEEGGAKVGLLLVVEYLWLVVGDGFQ